MEIKWASVLETIDNRVNEYISSDFKIDKNKREIITDTDDDKILVRVWIDFNEDNQKLSEKSKSSKTWSEIKNIKKLINNDEQLHHKVHAATVSGRRNHLKIVYPIS